MTIRVGYDAKLKDVRWPFDPPPVATEEIAEWHLKYLREILGRPSAEPEAPK